MQNYNDKIEILIKQILYFKERGEQVSTIENIIENDIHYEFNGILDRLSDNEGRKNNILQKEISFLQNSSPHDAEFM